jgi:hypothetical protein
MVDFARIQNRIYYGYGKAAVRLGTNHAIYRSTDGINPIQEANFLFNQLISIDQNYKYTSPKKYGDPVWQFLPEDGLQLQNFDYMVGGTTTYFIGDIKPDDRLSPPVCVECNATMTIYRPVTTRTAGTNAYQTFDQANLPKILVNCPVSILQHSKTDAASTMKLPTGVKLPFYNVYLPEFVGVIIKTGDVVVDNKGRRLAVINTESTRRSLGFRILAAELGT